MSNCTGITNYLGRVVYVIFYYGTRIVGSPYPCFTMEKNINEFPFLYMHILSIGRSGVLNRIAAILHLILSSDKWLFITFCTISSFLRGSCKTYAYRLVEIYNTHTKPAILRDNHLLMYNILINFTSPIFILPHIVMKNE